MKVLIPMKITKYPQSYLLIETRNKKYKKKLEGHNYYEKADLTILD